MYWGNLKHLRTLWRIIRPKPIFLYKYHTVNQYLSELLEKNSFWACSASDLNDPYDCNFELTNEFFKTKYLDQISFKNMGISPSSPQEEEKFWQGLSSAFDQTMLKSFQEHYRSQMRVCCFSANPVSELMWSHYADSGKGICLEFNFRLNPELEKKIIPISYSNKPISVVNDVDRFKALFQKRTAWSYEKEWRVLSVLDHIPFLKPNLVGIIFGPKISPDDVRWVLELCTQHNYVLKFSVCEYAKSGLDIKLLD